MRVAKGEVGGVVGAEADAGDDDLRRLRVGLDERDDLVQDPVLVAAVLLGPLLEREPFAVPAAGVEAVDRVDLDPPLLDRPADRVDHPALLVLPGRPFLRGEGEERPAPVAVRDHAALGPDRRRVEGDVVPVQVRTSAAAGVDGDGASRAMRPNCGRRGTRAGERRSRGHGATPRVPGSRPGSPRRCRMQARSGSSARDGCGGRRRRSARSARSAESASRSSRPGERSCPTGGRGRRSSPGGAGGCGRGRARPGSPRARSGTERPVAGEGSPRRAPASSAPRPSRSRSGRPARSGRHGAVAAARGSGAGPSARRTRARRGRRAAGCARSRRDGPRSAQAARP